MTPAQRERYERVRLALVRAMAGDSTRGRVTLREAVDACHSAGHAVSYDMARSVRLGRRVSRPVLSLLTAAVRAVRARRSEGLPEWL